MPSLLQPRPPPPASLRRVRAAVLVVALAAATPAVPAVAGALQAGTSGTSAEYLEAVRRYRTTADRDPVVQELLSWEPGALRQAVRRAGLEALPLERRAATLLHGDVGILAYRRGEVALGDFHLELGLELLERGGSDHGATWPHRWLLAIGLFHASGSTPGDAIPFLKHALEVYPDDSQLLLVLGQVEENLATRQLRGWAPRKTRGDHRRDVRYETRKNSTDGSLLKDAEAHYLRALAADPGLHEARLHLGRVLQARGQSSEARKALEAVLAAEPEVYLVYMAKLLLGALDESAGDLAAAAHRYRDALAADEHSQVAVLALAHVTHRMGDRRESADMVEQLLSRRVRLTLRPDGWWRFRMGPLGDRPRSRALLQELREEVVE